MPPVSPASISLPDRYRVIRHLANGGMASVWEAHDELLDRAVAVKVLASHLGEDDRARRRFQREARAAAGLSSHPHVVTIYDVGEHQRRVFMVMEIMRGGSIADRLRSGRDISHEELLRWLREAAGALDTAHEAGVVHRDIKPANLLLDEHGRLAVADFGIARLAWEDQLTATGQVLGTAAYLSPEQAMGEPATAASDLYALAVVAYELLTGKRPFEAEHFAAQARAHVEDPVPPASSRTDGLSRAVDAVLERGLAKEPGDRWDSATQFVTELERTVGAQQEEATRPTRRLFGRAPVPADTEERPAPPPPRREPWTDVAHRGDGDNGNGAGRRAAPAPPPRRRNGAPLLAGLGALALIAVIAAVALAARGNESNDKPRAQNTPEATATATAEKTAEPTDTPTPEKTDTPTPAPTETATQAPTDTPTPETKKPPKGKTDLKAARKAQLEGFNARRAGDYQTALAKAREAQQLCGNARELDPCGYALFEEGASLNALGQPDAAIPVLQRRLDEYGDNESGEVTKELEKAKRAAGKGQ